MSMRFGSSVSAYTLLLVGATVASQAGAQSGWRMQPAPIQTRWAKQVSPSNALPEYPRPQMVRPRWQNLNGLWDYAITAKDDAQPSAFAGKILVPYPVESSLSGVKKALQPTDRLWYKRKFARPAAKKGERVLLHFGAVDWESVVKLNGKEIGQHRGGYQNFTFDITDDLVAGSNELVVSVWDPTEGDNPRGKQVLKPSGIMYTATSGIWQTVWLETVPAVSIASLKLTPDVDGGVLHVSAIPSKEGEAGYTVRVKAKNGAQTVGTATGKPGDVIDVLVPKAHLWSPSDPYLYDLSVELVSNGKVVDAVSSYFGMRKLEVKKDQAGVDRLFLNGKYTYNLGVLDQGFWPDGIYTAPTDEALAFDVRAIKAMGFNTIRKHIKIEPARWYYHCDKIGMLVWQDMPQPGSDKADGKAEFEKESAENIAQLYNSPSIVVWVLFNEGWGAYDQERLAKWMKRLDPSRLLNGHTGGYSRTDADGKLESTWVDADMTDTHAYPEPGIPPAEAGKARVLGEYGGIGSTIENHVWDAYAGWGYISKTPAELATTYDEYVKKMKGLEEQGLSGSIYTEPFDVETEQNGLMTYDRKVIKIALPALRKINAQIIGPTTVASFDASKFPAEVAKPVYPNLTLEGMLAQFRKGRSDLPFLHGLLRKAEEAKDMAAFNEVGDKIFAGMKDVFTKENIELLSEITSNSDSKGFAIFKNDSARVDQVMGNPGFAKRKVDQVLSLDLMAILMRDGKLVKEEPDWAGISRKMSAKYDPQAVDRDLTGFKAQWYLQEKKWAELINMANAEISKNGKKDSRFPFWGAAQGIMVSSNDTTQLLTAASWIEEYTKNDEGGMVLDLYASVLYKAGKKTEGIAAEEAAVSAATNHKNPYMRQFAANLAKMRNGEWTPPEYK